MRNYRFFFSSDAYDSQLCMQLFTYGPYACTCLQSRVQLLSSAVQKSQMVKLNFIQCQSETGKRKTLVDESHRQSCLVNTAAEQEVTINIKVGNLFFIRNGLDNYSLEFICLVLINEKGIIFIFQASCDIVNAMRQELNASDGEIKSLRKFFLSRIKLKGEPSCVDAISLVHDHLKTRTCCRLIRQDLQVFLIHAMILLTHKITVLCH